MEPFPLSVMSGGLLLLLMIVSWAIPIVFAIWLIRSINEIKNLLREIRTALTERGGG